MKTRLLNSSYNIYLTLSIASLVIAWAISNLLGQQTSIIVNNILYIPLSLLLVLTAGFQLLQKSVSRNIIMWILFFIFSLSFMIAQHIWALDELILDITPFPSLADLFYIIGTICLIPFFILFIKSTKESISRSTFIVSLLIGSSIILFSIYFFLATSPTLNLENILLVSYPISDGILIIPAFIGITLYFRKKLTFPRSVICFAIIFETLGDVMFQIMTTYGTYFTGSLTDLFLLLPFVLFTFGIYREATPLKSLGVKTK